MYPTTLRSEGYATLVRVPFDHAQESHAEGPVSKGVRARLRAGSRRGFDEPACASLRLPCDARASGQVRKLGPEYRASNSADLDRKRSDPDTLRFSAAHSKRLAAPP